MTSKKLKWYVAKRRNGWTLQCPHEDKDEDEYSGDISVIHIDDGEIVMCDRCFERVVGKFMKEWNDE